MVKQKHPGYPYPKYNIFRIENKADFRAGDFEFFNGCYIAIKDGTFRRFYVTAGGGSGGAGLDSLAREMAEHLAIGGYYTISYKLPFTLFSISGALYKAIRLDSSERELFESELEKAVKDAYEARTTKKAK
jgi:hypothetical protein